MHSVIIAAVFMYDVKTVAPLVVFEIILAEQNFLSNPNDFFIAPKREIGYNPRMFKIVERKFYFMAKPGKAFIFFNCDADKSEASMNIFYNKAVFKDTKTSRKNLWKKIKEEYGAERIQIATDNLRPVELAITEGDPVTASDFIQFGAIRAVDCY